MMVWDTVGDYYRDEPISKSHVERSFYIFLKIVWKYGAHSMVYAIWLVHIRTVPWLIPPHYLRVCTPVVILILMVMEIFSLHFSSTYFFLPTIKSDYFPSSRFITALSFLFFSSSLHRERNYYKHEGSLRNFPHFGYCPQLLSPPNHNGWFK